MKNIIFTLITFIDNWYYINTHEVNKILRLLYFQNGTLKIIDRKRHIFKLSQGEYIVPEKIETIYLKSQYVHQVFVHGESIKVNNH